MPNREGSKASKASKAPLREGQNPSQNGGPGELPVDQAGPLVPNEREGTVVRRARRIRHQTQTSQTSGEEVEKPGTLTKKQIAALQYAYVNAGGSMEKLARFFGLSLSTVSKYCSGLEVKAPVETDTAIQTSSVAPTAVAFQVPVVQAPPTTNGDDTEPLAEENEVAHMPRLSSEVAARRPIIVDETNESPQQQAVHNQPQSTVMISDEPLLRLFSYSALSKGMTIEAFIEQIVLPDLRTMGIIRAALPGSTNEELETNFLRTVEDANAFRRLTRISREEARREMEMGGKNNGSNTA